MFKGSTAPQARTKTVSQLVAGAMAAPVLLAVLPAAAQSNMTMADQQKLIEQQQQTIQEMQRRMNDLQSRFDSFSAQQPANSASAPPPAQEQPAPEVATKSEPVEGFKVGNTTFELGGYMKVDAIYDFNGDNGASLGPSDVQNQDGVPVTNHDPHFGATAKQSRLTIGTTTPTSLGEVGSYFEMDFYGDSFGLDGSYQPRLRQGYITVGNFLIGKAWSTFSDFNYGTMLNFYGPQAQLFERQEQVRYTWNIDSDHSLDLGVETSDGQTIANNASGGSDEQFPDLAARFNGKAGNLSYQAAAIVSYIEADTIGSDEDSTVGYGFDLGGTYALPTDTTLMLSANYAKGAAKYVYDPAGAPDAYVNGNGNLETIERYGYIATLSQKLAPQWETNLVWGQAFSEEYLDDPTVHDRSSTAAINLLYTPVDPLTLGIEYDRAAYRNHAGQDGEANWLQMSAIYNF